MIGSARADVSRNQRKSELVGDKDVKRSTQDDWANGSKARINHRQRCVGGMGNKRKKNEKKGRGVGDDTFFLPQELSTNHIQVESLATISLHSTTYTWTTTFNEFKLFVKKDSSKIFSYIVQFCIIVNVHCLILPGMPGMPYVRSLHFQRLGVAYALPFVFPTACADDSHHWHEV